MRTLLFLSVVVYFDFILWVSASHTCYLDVRVVESANVDYAIYVEVAEAAFAADSRDFQPDLGHIKVHL